MISSLARAALGLAVAVLLTAPAGTAAAATAGDWPCIQVKVPRLSIGQMWSGVPAAGDWREDRTVRELALRLASRRLDLAEAEPLVAEFAAAAGADKAARLSLLFAGVFDVIDGERARVMAGIERYSKRQQALADRIRDESAEVTALTTAAKANATTAASDAAEDAQTKLDWDMRIYTEREQSLTYVCEVPVLFEQRAFALARMLQQKSQ